MSMRPNKPVFRHEIKYLITNRDCEVLRHRLKDILRLDENTTGSEYSVRSMYFDDYWASAYNDKVDGHSDRKKYRIRTYDLNPDNIRLECKIKSGSYVNKQSVSLSKDEYDKIIEGDYAFLLKRREGLCGMFYFELTGRVARPSVIVDYEREPYILDAGTVRVTLDKNVRAIAPGFGLLYGDAPCRHVLEPGKAVLEVKYTEFLPTLIRQLLPLRGAELGAVSKYVLCSEKTNYLLAR